MAKAKKEESNEAEFNSKDFLGDILKDSKGDHYNDIISSNWPISFGSLQVDSHIVVRSGQVIRLAAAGPEMGKSSQAVVFAENYMTTVPKSKTILIKAEGRCSPEFQKRTGAKYVVSADKWEYGTIFIWSVNYFETIASGLESLLKNMHEAGEHLCIIWDSLDGTILKADAQKNVWGGSESPKVAGVPLLMKLLFKRFALPVSHYDALMIVITQYSAAIKLDPYSKDTPRQVEGSGGSSIGHQSDHVFFYHPRYNGDYILEKPDEKPDLVKNKVLGMYVTIEVKKGSSDITGTKFKVPVARKRIGCAIWAEKEVVDMALAYGHVIKKGAWLSFDENYVAQAKADGVEIKVQHQGLNNLFIYVEENKDVFNWMLNLYRKTLINPSIENQKLEG